MSEPIEPTPIIKGEAAEKILKEINDGEISEVQKKFLEECEDIYNKQPKKKEGINRIEVVDENGRKYSKWDCEVYESVQDRGKTLKIFVYANNKTKKKKTKKNKQKKTELNEAFRMAANFARHYIYKGKDEL